MLVSAAGLRTIACMYKVAGFSEGLHKLGCKTLSYKQRVFFMINAKVWYTLRCRSSSRFLLGSRSCSRYLSTWPSSSLHTARAVTAMAAKLKDAELVEAASLKFIAQQKHRLIDVGINLADPSYDKAIDWLCVSKLAE